MCLCTYRMAGPVQVIPGLGKAVRRDKRWFIIECEAEHPGALPRALLRLHRLLRPLPRAALRALAPYATFLCRWIEGKVDLQALNWNCLAGDQMRAPSVERCVCWLREAGALLEAVSRRHSRSQATKLMFWPSFYTLGGCPMGHCDIATILKLSKGHSPKHCAARGLSKQRQLFYREDIEACHQQRKHPNRLCVLPRPLFERQIRCVPFTSTTYVFKRNDGGAFHLGSAGRNGVRQVVRECPAALGRAIWKGSAMAAALQVVETAAKLHQELEPRLPAESTGSVASTLGAQVAARPHFCSLGAAWYSLIECRHPSATRSCQQVSHMKIGTGRSKSSHNCTPVRWLRASSRRALISSGHAGRCKSAQIVR